MSNDWGGKRENSGRKSYSELQRCREQLNEAITPEQWRFAYGYIYGIMINADPEHRPVTVRESIAAGNLLFRLHYALIPSAEEEKQAEEPEPIKLIEVHRSCERDCPVHPEYHEAVHDDPASGPSRSGGASSSEFPQVLPSSAVPAEPGPEPPYPGSPVGKYKYDGIPLEKIPSYKYDEPDFLSHIQPPPGPDLLGPSASVPPEPVEEPHPAPAKSQGSRKRVMALLEQERRSRLGSNPPVSELQVPVVPGSTIGNPKSTIQNGAGSAPRAPVPPTPGVPPKPEDFIPLPQEFYRCIGRIPLSKWNLPAGCYIMPDGGKLIHGAGARPKRPASQSPGPGS